MFTVKCAFITSRCLQRSTTWFYKRILSDEAAFTVNTHNRVTMPSNSHTMQHKTSLSTLPYYGILHQASVSTKEYTPSSPTLQLYKYSINPQLQHNTSFPNHTNPNSSISTCALPTPRVLPTSPPLKWSTSLPQTGTAASTIFLAWLVSVARAALPIETRQPCRNSNDYGC